MKTLIGVLAPLALFAGAAHAQGTQGLTVSGALRVYMADQLAEIERSGDVCCEYVTEALSAALLGGEIAVRYRWIRLTAAGLMGEPSSDDGAVKDEDLRLSTVSLHAVVGSTLSFGPEIDVWRSSRPYDGVRRELLIKRLGLSVAVAAGLGIEGLKATFAGSIYPVGSADLSGIGSESGWILGEGSDVQNRLRVGLEYRLDSAPVWFALRYRGERFASIGADDVGFVDELFVERNQLRGIDLTVGVDVGG